MPQQKRVHGGRKPETHQRHVAPTRLSVPAAAADPAFLTAAAGRLRRQSRAEYNPEVHPAWYVAMWVDVQRERPAHTVQPFSLHDAGDLALLAVGWTGVVQRMHPTIPDVVTTLTTVDPTTGGGTGPTLIRTLCGGPTHRDPTRPPSTVRRRFDLTTESAWLHCSLALAEQLAHLLAARPPFGWRLPELATPTLGYVTPGVPEPPDGTPGPAVILPVADAAPADLEGREFVWMTGSIPTEAVEYDQLGDVIRRIRWCSPWALYQGNILHPTLEFPTMTVSYDLR